MKKSLEDLCGVEEPFNLVELLSDFQFPNEGLYKCRILYDDLTHKVEFLPYVPKIVNSLKVIEDNDISYQHKYANRKDIEALFARCESCDDILIIKDDHVTDSSYSNIVFKRDGAWFTPYSVLLHGTQRQLLLEREVIREEKIRKEDIPSFESFKLINAMLGFDGPEVNISNIIF